MDRDSYPDEEVPVESKPLPTNARTYTDSIIERCESLIDAGVWGGLPKQRLDGWLSNFIDERERFLAARILDSLIYRSAAQTDAMIRQLFQRSVPDVLRSPDSSKANHHDIIERLSSRSDTGIRIVPVVTEEDAPSKSGPAVCRQSKRLLGINEKWISYAWKVGNQAKVIIFVDDFLGTGFQFASFFRKSGFDSLHERTKFVYAPLVAHERGIEHLNRNFPFLHLTFAERLDASYNLFNSVRHRDSNGFTDVDLRAIYDSFILRKRLNTLKKRVLGYAALGLAFAFEHATPNASLPILWLSSRPNLRPLFTR